MLHFKKTFMFKNAHLLFKLIFKATKLQKLPEYDIFQKTLFCTLASSMNLGLNAVLVASGQYLWSAFTFIYLTLINFGVSMHLKQVKTKRKIFRQYWAKHLETFSLFSTISLYHKWNGTKLLSPESECTSCLTSWQTI